MKHSLLFLLLLCSCKNTDKYGREYQIKEITVTWHWHDWTSHYTIGKCVGCGTSHHHDKVVDTYTIDTIYTEYRIVHDKTIYRK